MNERETTMNENETIVEDDTEESKGPKFRSGKLRKQGGRARNVANRTAKRRTVRNKSKGSKSSKGSAPRTKAQQQRARTKRRARAMAKK